MTPSDRQIETLRQRVDSLTASQQKKLREQLEAQGIAWSSICPEQTETASLKWAEHSRPEQLPLTSSQAHVWVLHQLYPPLCAYHIPFAWHFQGKLDVVSLTKSLNALVARHESLRTVFCQDEAGQPYQELLASCLCELPIVEVQKHEIAAVAKELTALPFDLALGPLFRFQLQRVNAEHHVLVIVLHHLIADGWSRGVLMRDVAKFYRGEKITHNSELCKLTYSVFLADQVWLKSKEHDLQLEYWKQHLLGITPLEVPTDYSRPAQATFASRTVTRSLSRELSDSLQLLAKRFSATPFMVLLTAFKVLMFRYTGQRDIALGVPVAGRRYEECSELIGFFVNTLVLRTQFNTDTKSSFADWLQQVKQTVLGGLEHQFVPFSSVVEACAPRRSAHRNPLFEIMFQMQSAGYQTQNSATPDIDFPNLTLTQQYLELPETKFDMSWHLFDREDELLLAVEYRTALFEERRVEQMLNHFEQLLIAIAAEPEQQVSSLPMISEEEQAKLLEMSKGPKLAEPVGVLVASTFHEAFALQAKLTPEAIAVRFGDAELTYCGLEERANILAEKLRTAGVRAGAIVGICLPRSIDLLVAVLGVLKSGNAYLPLDPQLPTSRREYMTTDANCALVIGNLDEILVDETVDTSAALTSGLNDCCYVIYTSGSTGKPKGTIITHPGLMHYLRWCTEKYPLTEGWGAPVQSSFGFDATITSMLAPLLVGKLVLMLPEKNELEALVDAIQTSPSIVKLTPAHLVAIEPLLPTDLPPEKMPKALVVGGEALTTQHVLFWREHYPDVQLFNEYGPTETVVGCSVYQVNEATKNQGNLPIGRPIAGIQLYVLDESHNLLPTGVPGELTIAGPGVANGYINQPTLTAERFVVNPFAKQTAGQPPMMYRTGDVVRYRADGVLEYLGRRDDQVQLRGYRIELGEIESALRQQAQVAECAVVVREETGQPQLIAYVTIASDVVMKESAELSKNLAAALRQELPEYMVPIHFKLLEKFPLTHNGKIDRRQLPVVERLVTTRAHVAPRNERETKLLAIWQKILHQNGIDQRAISVEDNFFDLSGDSIRGMQIVAAARRVGLKLTPAQLFEHQTIAAQAIIAEEILTPAVESQQALVGEIPLAPQQWELLQRDLPEPHHFNQGILLKTTAELDLPRLQESLQRLVKHHDGLRLRFEPTDSREWRQWYAAETECNVPVENVALRDVNDFQTVMAAEISKRQNQFNLRKGPLLRAVRFQLGNSESDRLLLLAHHLVVDGMSWRILLNDLDYVYKQLTTGEQIALPPKTSSFGWWTRHLLKHEDQFAMDLEQITQTTEVPALFERVETNTWEHCSTLRISQPVEMRDVDEAILLTALTQTLKQFTHKTTLVIDLENHGRHAWEDSMDLTETVGWFTAIYSLALTLPEAGSEMQLAYIRSQLSQVPNQGISLGVLRMTGQTRKSTVQVSFNFLGNLDLPASQIVIGLAPESIPDLCSPTTPRPYLMDVVCWFAAGKLEVMWRYNQQVHSQTTIQQLAERFLSAIQSLVAAKQQSQQKKVPTHAVGGGMDKLLSKLQSRDQ